MSNITKSLHGSLIEHVFLQKIYVPPQNLYMALFSDVIPIGGAGVEIKAGEYRRQVVKLRKGEGPQPMIYNTNIVMFPKALTDWGNIVEVAIMDAAEGGTMLMHTRIDMKKAKRIEEDDVFSYEVGGFRIRY